MNTATNRASTLEVKPLKPNSMKSAAERAEEIRSGFDGGSMDEGTDDFFVEPDKIPNGWTYEWKRFTIYNQEDPSYQVQLRRQGWEPVPSERHPEMMPIGSTEEKIIRKGMMLMERPTEITNEIRRIDQKRAKAQVQVKEQQLNDASPGQFERSNDGSKMSKIKKSYEPIPVPDKT